MLQNIKVWFVQLFQPKYVDLAKIKQLEERGIIPYFNSSLGHCNYCGVVLLTDYLWIDIFHGGFYCEICKEKKCL